FEVPKVGFWGRDLGFPWGILGFPRGIWGRDLRKGIWDFHGEFWDFKGNFGEGIWGGIWDLPRVQGLILGWDFGSVPGQAPNLGLPPKFSVGSAPLVPVFSFGENELFLQVPNPPGSRLRRLQGRLQRLLGVALPLFHARGVFQYSFGLLPFRRPIHTVVGAPLELPRVPQPSAEQVELWHGRYRQRLRELFEEHKGRFGVPPERRLSFV
uniref:Uncharacterized protein n=1 Tax=Geospiza parvula TaxID=87175 RepID=A0A8U8B498_GEOPR